MNLLLPRYRVSSSGAVGLDWRDVVGLISMSISDTSRLSDCVVDIGWVSAYRRW